MPCRLATTFAKLTPERYAAIAAEMRAVADGGTDAAKVVLATAIAEAVLEVMARRPANLADAVANATAEVLQASLNGGEAASPIVYGPFTEEDAAALARLEAVEAERHAALQQIQDERLDAALIGEMKADAQLVAQNRAILDALEVARVADGGEVAGEDDGGAASEDGEAAAGKEGKAAGEDGEAAAGEDDGDDEAAGEDDGIFFSDSDEDMPDVPAGPAGEDDDGWGSSIEFEMSNAGVILISDDDE